MRDPESSRVQEAHAACDRVVRHHVQCERRFLEYLREVARNAQGRKFNLQHALNTIERAIENRLEGGDGYA